MNKFDGRTALLTPAQLTLFQRRWVEVTRVNHWRLIQKRLDPGAIKDGFSDYHRLVWDYAQQLAAERVCAVVPDLLHRACVRAAVEQHHQQAGLKPFGTWCSIKALDNARFSLWLTLAKLLIAPRDLEALIEWDDPQARHDRSVVGFLHSREAAARAIAANMFGSRRYECLDGAQKEKIARMLRASHRGYRDVRRPIRTHASDDDDGLSVPGSLVDCARR